MSKALLYVHIGTHKTGSSAIQSFLSQNDVLLRERGYLYLQAFKQLMPLMVSEKADSGTVFHCKKALMSLVRRSKHRGEDLVLSWEGFSGNPRTGYSNVEVVADQLKQITAAFDVRVIVYLRRQDHFIESMYTQTVQEGESYTFQSFQDALPPGSFDWEHLVSCYAKYFGKKNIIPRRYDKLFLPQSTSLLHDFCAVIGVESRGLTFSKESTGRNAGYSRDALEIARLSNPYLDAAQRQRLRNVLQYVSSKRPFENYAYFTEAKRSSTLAHYDRTNSLVAREYFHEPSGVLFPRSDGDESPRYQGLSLEAAIPILVKAIVIRNESIIVRLLIKLERRTVAFLEKYPRVFARVRNWRRRVSL